MSRQEYIEYCKKQIRKYGPKVKKTKLRFLKEYYMGKVYIYSENLRRLTGKKHI